MKKILSVILALFVFASFALTVSATEVCVQDNAVLLTDEERTEIIYECERLSQEYQVAVLVHTTMSTDGVDIHTYAENFYYENASCEDGLVFVINLNNNEVGNRDFYTYYQGSIYDTFGDEAYNSDYGYVNSAVLPYLAGENYYDAFLTYLKVTESYLSGGFDYSEDYYTDDFYGDAYYADDYYTDGTVYYPSSSMSPVVKELIVIAVAAIVAFVVTSIMKSKMNTAVIKNEASDYVKSGSMNVTRRLDVFTHRHVTRTAKPKNNSSSGGHSGGGASAGGGGGRSGGGGGKF